MSRCLSRSSKHSVNTHYENNLTFHPPPNVMLKQPEIFITDFRVCSNAFLSNPDATHTPPVATWSSCSAGGGVVDDTVNDAHG